MDNVLGDRMEQLEGRYALRNRDGPRGRGTFVCDAMVRLSMAKRLKEQDDCCRLHVLLVKRSDLIIDPPLVGSIEMSTVLRRKVM